MNANDQPNGAKDRDPALEELLTRMLNHEPQRAGEHLDDEVVARWFEKTLSSDERARAETHLADCPRCQAVMAAMVRTEPALAAVRAPEASVSSRWLWWLAPATAAIAAAGIWMVVVRQPSERASPVAMARVESPAEPQAAPASPSAPAVAEPRAEPPAAPSIPPSSPTRERQQAFRDTTPVPEAAAKSQAGAEEKRADAFTDRNALEPGRPASPPPVAAAAPRPALEVAQAQALDSSAGIVVAPPEGRTRWRLSGTSIAGSPDGGAQWTTVYQGSAPLTAGAAPSSSVCWVVGAAGTVLRSTDGAAFVRVAFPAAVDLVRVGATDDSVAAVTAADGRVFSTIDGGRTWVVR